MDLLHLWIGSDELVDREVLGYAEVCPEVQHVWVFGIHLHELELLAVFLLLDLQGALGLWSTTQLLSLVR